MLIKQIRRAVSTQSSSGPLLEAVDSITPGIAIFDTELKFDPSRLAEILHAQLSALPRSLVFGDGPIVQLSESELLQTIVNRLLASVKVLL